MGSSEHTREFGFCVLEAPIPGDGTHLAVLGHGQPCSGELQHTSFSLQAGPPVCKPDVISHLERGEEPWWMPREVPGGSCPGEWGTQWKDVQTPASQDHPPARLLVVLLPFLPSTHTEDQLCWEPCWEYSSEQNRQRHLPSTGGKQKSCPCLWNHLPSGTCWMDRGGESAWTWGSGPPSPRRGHSQRGGTGRWGSPFTEVALRGTALQGCEADKRQLSF